MARQYASRLAPAHGLRRLANFPRCTSIRCMRTTLAIDDDVLQAAKEIARRDKKTAGAVISDLARLSLTRPPERRSRKRKSQAAVAFRPFPSRGRIVTNEQIDRLRDEDAY